MQNPINTTSTLFCPRSSCKYYQFPENKISKDGTYTTKSDPKPRQMLYCHGGKHRFSETGYSDLFGKHGSFKEYEQTAKLTSYGLALDAIADVIQKDRRTIEQWQRAIGKKGEQFHLFLCITIGITILFLQMDELWSYVKNKNRQLWVFIALESQTKFWITFELGSRTIYTASRLVKGLKRLARLGKDCILKVTTDKLAAYKKALEKFMDNNENKKFIRKYQHNTLGDENVIPRLLPGGRKKLHDGLLARGRILLFRHFKYFTEKRKLFINFANYNLFKPLFTNYPQLP